jgi:hypothetical protein
LSQSNINASDALGRAHTELRNYWKRNLEGKIVKPGGKNPGKGSYKHESAYAFSGGKQKGNQGKYSSAGQSQPQTSQGNFTSKRGVGNKSWKKFEGHCRYCGMQGHKGIYCGARKQNLNAPSGNESKNQKKKCYLCGKQGHYSMNCPDN